MRQPPIVREYTQMIAVVGGITEACWLILRSRSCGVHPAMSFLIARGPSSQRNRILLVEQVLQVHHAM